MLKIKRIHINQHNIKHNKKSKNKKPVISIKTSKRNQCANSIEIHGPCRVVYSPNKPLSCGATVWIETVAKITKGNLKND